MSEALQWAAIGAVAVLALSALCLGWRAEQREMARERDSEFVWVAVAPEHLFADRWRLSVRQLGPGLAVWAAFDLDDFRHVDVLIEGAAGHVGRFDTVGATIETPDLARAPSSITLRWTGTWNGAERSVRVDTNAWRVEPAEGAIP